MGNPSGALGEQAAADLLEQAGYRIVARNYHSRWGEIDIIVCDAQYIIFVEVKTRKDVRKAEPEEAVTLRKQKKIIQTALTYLQEYPQWQQYQPRFDVAALTLCGTDVKNIRYFTDAFRLDCDQGGFF